MNPIQKLHQLGQSIWYDNIQRRLLVNGDLERMIRAGEIRGVTSNPSIFQAAIAKSTDYDTALKPMAWAGWSSEQIFDQLALEDIRAAADLFLPLYQETQGADGYVSLEVNPRLANATTEAAAEAQRQWQAVDRPNLMIKIPATPAGVPAIRQSIAAGINVNVTLIFSLTRYAEVMEAYLSGLEDRVAAGRPIDTIASVASFFVSRVDSKIDKRLEEIVRAEGEHAARAARLPGQAAIANARLAYALFRDTFGGERFASLQRRGARLQRPLWASTSTKNPAYPDVLYVEELIGPDTVNTVPPQTLDAYRDHGSPRATLAAGLEEARAALAELDQLCISMDEVTNSLEQEGVKAFSDAYESLIQTIEQRRQAAQAELGPLAGPVAERVQQLAADRVPQRIWERDPSLWAADPAGQEEIRKRLGWLRLPETSLLLVNEIEQFAEEVRAAGMTHVLLLGMGGSSLAPEVLASLLEQHPETRLGPGMSLEILDSTDPDQVRAAARRAPVERTLYVVSSKSGGGTIEVNAFLSFFWQRARRLLREQTGAHFVAITDPGTSLETLARERGFRKIFTADPTVGGRYSALSAFGLVPAGLMGFDLNRLLLRAQHMQRECAPDVPAGRNPGLVLGAILGQGALLGMDKLTFLADPDWSAFGSWLEQLIAESSGKQGKGIVPVDGEPLIRAARYPQDRLFVQLRGRGEMDASSQRLREFGHPSLKIDMPDPYSIGAEFYRWEFATAAACAVLGVNAFDQPDVQDNKNRTTKILAGHQVGEPLHDGEPIWKNEQARVYGEPFAGLDRAQSFSDLVSSFLQHTREGDYIAINAYLPRNRRNQVALRRLRHAILGRTAKATTVGFGPRFLHSTGQLHKGGADNGIFFQITMDSYEDLPVPGQPYSFADLERAQALGDLQALQARGRRAIRLHLREDALEELIQTLTAVRQL